MKKIRIRPQTAGGLWAIFLGLALTAKPGQAVLAEEPANALSFVEETLNTRDEDDAAKPLEAGDALSERGQNGNEQKIEDELNVKENEDEKDSKSLIKTEEIHDRQDAKEEPEEDPRERQEERDTENEINAEDHGEDGKSGCDDKDQKIKTEDGEVDKLSDDSGSGGGDD